MDPAEPDSSGSVSLHCSRSSCNLPSCRCGPRGELFFFIFFYFCLIFSDTPGGVVNGPGGRRLDKYEEPGRWNEIADPWMNPEWRDSNVTLLLCSDVFHVITSQRGGTVTGLHFYHVILLSAGKKKTKNQKQTFITSSYIGSSSAHVFIRQTTTFIALLSSQTKQLSVVGCSICL